MSTVCTIRIASVTRPSAQLCSMMNSSAAQRLADQEGGRREGLADEAAQRVDLVLDHGGDFGAPHPPVLREREAQHPVDELVAQAAQHALAEPALVGVDVELERAVDDDVAEERGMLSATSAPMRSSSKPLNNVNDWSPNGLPISIGSTFCVASGVSKPLPWIGPLTMSFGMSNARK